MPAEVLSRRPACIVFADAVGFTRLAAEDEEGTFFAFQRVLGLYSSIITEHGGQIVNRAGDAVLARFPTVASALAASIAAQRRLGELPMGSVPDARIQLRIGINVGSVIESGSEIFGHGINVAARLQSVAEPGGICLSEAVREQLTPESGVVLRPLGLCSFKNIKEPLLVHAVDLEATGPLLSENFGKVRVEPEAPALLPAPSREAPARRVLILPFSVFSENREIVHVADGLCEDIITELSRFRSIAVLARTTAFAFKGTTKTIREVGQEVRASYVLEGSLRPVGSKLRLTVQLIDPASEGHVWAEKFDFDLSELMITQDLLVSRIVSLLEGRIESSRLKAIGKLGPQSLDAFDCWLRGHALMRNWRIGDDETARHYFERAAQLDPSFARPHASLAGIYSASAFLLPGSPAIDELLAQAREHAQKAMNLDPNDGKVLTHLGWVNMLERSFGQAAAAFDAAGEANPNDAEVTISRALASAYLGETDRAMQLARHAFELDPYRADYHYGYRAVITFLHGDYQTSIDLFERMQEIAPPDLLVWYGSALERSGDRQRHDGVVSGFRKMMPALWQGRRKPLGADLSAWFFRVTPLKRKSHSEKISRAFFAD